MKIDRTFSLDEAHQVLPVLRGLLRTAMDSRKRIAGFESEFSDIRNRIMVFGGLELDILHLARRRAQCDKAVQTLKDSLAEIEASGAQVKDLDMGLLDFPCVVQDRVILLCWKMGEKTITHWHGTDEGYSSRKPLDQRLLRAQKQRPAQ